MGIEQFLYDADLPNIGGTLHILPEPQQPFLSGFNNPVFTRIDMGGLIPRDATNVLVSFVYETTMHGETVHLYPDENRLYLPVTRGCILCRVMCAEDRLFLSLHGYTGKVK